MVKGISKPYLFYQNIYSRLLIFNKTLKKKFQHDHHAKLTIFESGCLTKVTKYYIAEAKYIITVYHYNNHTHLIQH